MLTAHIECMHSKNTVMLTAHIECMHSLDRYGQQPVSS